MRPPSYSGARPALSTRATGSGCSRLALIEADAFSVARPPAFPQELPPGADVVGFSLAGLYQEHRAAGLRAALEALCDDLGVIVEHGTLGFAEATALDAAGGRGNALFQRLRDRPVALSVVDPGENYRTVAQEIGRAHV